VPNDPLHRTAASHALGEFEDPKRAAVGELFVRREDMDMITTSKVQFQPKWKEELVCTMDGRSFVVELTMGVLTVYFPTQSKWQTSAPDWAKQQWERVKGDLSIWCEQKKIPLVIEDHAWAQFE
jgi:hypothetical protein